MPQRASLYKARPKFQGRHVSVSDYHPGRVPLMSTDAQQTPKEDKTNLILRPKMST